MPRVLRGVTVTGLAVALLAGMVTPAGASGKGRPELRDAMQNFIDIGFAGMQVRVHDERGDWTSSVGVRELGHTAKPPTNGRFRIGSVTKAFVATLVLQLVADGEIGLDTPVDDYLPEFGLDRRITVRMLLQHTSGLFNITGEYYPDGTVVAGIPWSGQEWVDNRFHTYQPEELVRFALSKPARFEPGTDWSYSNTNYVLAGLLIEKVSGRWYGDEMERRILKPLGLTGTMVPGTWPEIPGPHAHGYYHFEHDGQWQTVDVTRQNPSWASSSGEMISTARDLQTFFAALQGGKLLPAPLLAEMREPHPKSGVNRYGLGLFVQDLDCGVTVYHHNGGLQGYGALMYSTPDGSKTLTASLTGGAATIDVVQDYPQALDAIAKAVFCGGQATG